MPKRIVNRIILATILLAISMFALGIQTSRAITSVYDVNGDGKVDIQDLALAAKAFASYPGHPKWNAAADVNSDGKVDIFDLGAIAKHFGSI